MAAGSMTFGEVTLSACEVWQSSLLYSKNKKINPLSVLAANKQGGHGSWQCPSSYFRLFSNLLTHLTAQQPHDIPHYNHLPEEDTHTNTGNNKRGVVETLPIWLPGWESKKLFSRVILQYQLRRSQWGWWLLQVTIKLQNTGTKQTGSPATLQHHKRRFWE